MRIYRFEILVLFLLACMAGTAKEYSTYSQDAHREIKRIPLEGAEYIIADSMALDTRYSLEQVRAFFRLFAHPFTDSEVDAIHRAAALSGIHYLVLVTKIQLESSLVTNPDRLTGRQLEYRKRWVLGYDMYRTMDGGYKPSGGFSKQVEGAARCLRTHMDRWREGYGVRINLGKVKVYPVNAITFALYQYTPFWGEFSENGTHCQGNEIFRPTYRYFLRYHEQAMATERAKISVVSASGYYSEIVSKVLTFLRQFV